MVTRVLQHAVFVGLIVKFKSVYIFLALHNSSHFFLLYIDVTFLRVKL